MSNQPDVFAPGAQVQQFRILERLGDSPKSSVWRAEDTRTGREVALKILSKQLPKEPAKRESVIREVRLAAAFTHPSLCPVQDFLAIGDSLVAVMELAQGRTLSAMFANAPAAPEMFFLVAYQIVDALRFVHGKNLVHGNVTGDNVIVSDAGQVKLTGLNLTTLYGKPGTPSTVYHQRGADARAVSYMAPEVITAQPVDPKSDIFSLGIVLYELATGRLPFPTGAAADVARAIVEGQPASPKTVNPKIEAPVLAVLGRCLFKDPAKRYRDAKSIAEDIAKAAPDAVKQVEAFTAKPVAAAAPGAQPSRRAPSHR